ncbi:MAG: hypothetical protein LBT59_13535 [Clostridiales bacterium]|jgi:hypothetical protein|nr:hypothetical protein [Clostridiales bacterium]
MTFTASLMEFWDMLFIRLGPKEGEETPLRMKEGKVSTANLIGYFRKLSATSEKIFEEITGNKEK